MHIGMRSTTKRRSRGQSARRRRPKVLLQSIAALALGAFAVSFVAAFGGREEPAPAQEPDEAVDREYVLEAFLDGYVGLEGDIEGQTNPVLTAAAGERVRVTIVNNEAMPHDIVMEEHGESSDRVTGPDGRTSVTFAAETDDVYFCSLPGHREAGMEGEFRIE
jgi:uncharacterized cupredoxin-like copper-binding protein